MADRLELRDIELWVTLGVPEAERAKPQRVLVTVSCPIEADKVARTDDVSQGLDYDRIVATLKTVAEGSRHTLEAFAEEIAKAVLQLGLASVSISITKFPYASPSAVTLSITRP